MRWAASVAAAGVVLAGCGGDDSTAVAGVHQAAATTSSAASERPPRTDAIVLSVAPNASSGTVQEVIEILRKRLDRLGLEGADVEEVADHTISVGFAATVDHTVDDVVEAVSRSGELRFRPVLAVLPGAIEDVELTAPDADTADQQVVLQERGPEGEVVATYQLGPAAAASSIVSGARAERSGGRWTVHLEMRADGIEAFNSIAAACHARSAICPTGQLALAVDSEVASAPSIEKPWYKRDQIQISGNFDEAEARRLALVLQDVLPARVEVMTVQRLAPPSAP
jgi:preprotein translocase subunit SecD